MVCWREERVSKCPHVTTCSILLRGRAIHNSKYCTTHVIFASTYQQNSWKTIYYSVNNIQTLTHTLQNKRGRRPVNRVKCCLEINQLDVVLVVYCCSHDKVNGKAECEQHWWPDASCRTPVMILNQLEREPSDIITQYTCCILVRVWMMLMIFVGIPQILRIPHKREGQNTCEQSQMLPWNQ